MSSFPQGAMAATVLVVIALAALVLEALRHRSTYALVILIVSIPILIFVLARGATRKRDRVHPSR